MNFWRQAGLNYVQYSSIAAKILRQALREPIRSEAVKREGFAIKFAKWQDGKVLK